MISHGYAILKYDSVPKNFWQASRAIAEGAPPIETRQPAWDALIRRLAQPFHVSAEVVRRRLEAEGLSVDELKA